MDTKLKKSRPFLAWLCFFLGLNLVIGLGLLGLSQAGDLYRNFDDIMASVRWDTKDVQAFKNEVMYRFNQLASYVQDKGNERSLEDFIKSLDQEGENLLYYAYHKGTQQKLTNMEEPSSVVFSAGQTLPSGYDYSFGYQDGRFMAYKDGKKLDIYRIGSGYSSEAIQPYKESADQELQVYLVVRKDIIENPYDESALFKVEKQSRTIRWINYGMASAMLAGILLLLASFIKRRSRWEFEMKLAKLTGMLWFEVKLILSALTLTFILSGGSDWRSVTYYSTYDYATDQVIYRTYSVNGTIQVALLMICCFWWLYLMFVDLRANRKQFFLNNSINWVLTRYRSYELRKPFQKAMFYRLIGLIAVESVLVIMATIAVISGRQGIPAFFFVVALGVYLLYRYMRRFNKTIGDMGRIIDRIEVIQSGNPDDQFLLDKDSDLYKASEQLNGIRNGIQNAVEEKLKSERMKVELITNVSHDLKTPLTSIVSYVDLLAREEALPDHVRDYIKVLSLKSGRLSTLIQDIFDLSKASSGAMELELEQLDLGKLILQTLADMEEQVAGSGLVFKTSLPEDAVMIRSDGKKLYRVFLNLIANTLKYALPASRVYIDLTRENGKAIAEIKNISNYEMNFNEEEITERFVRGDKSRSTEGSGLGLAIARNFTQACGGSFEIKIDGDLFKVRLIFGLSLEIAA